MSAASPGRREALPSGVGRKSLAELFGELSLRRNGIGDPAHLSIMKRAAAERRETRAKNQASVGQVRLRYDPFAQTGNAGIEHRQDEPVDHLTVFRRRNPRFHRLAVLPLVNPAACLLAKIAR